VTSGPDYATSMPDAETVNEDWNFQTGRGSNRSGDALPIDLLTVRRTLLCAGVQDMSMTFSKVMMANASWQKPV
ncbi:hypothetical protein ACT9C3_004400, partial [Shigella flexneri]